MATDFKVAITAPRDEPDANRPVSLHRFPCEAHHAER